MDLAWMSRLCNPRHPQPIAHHPVTLTVDEVAWALATEGHILVAVRENAPSGFPPAPAQQLATLTQLLAAPRAEGHADLAALRAWAGPPQWPGPEPCTPCAGTGTVRCETCDGDGQVDCVCASCSDEHEAACRTCRYGQADCHTCDGTGQQGGKLPIRPGWIGPTLVNRELLARALAELPGETATLTASSAHDPLYVDGPGWRVVVMPMSDRWITSAPEWSLTP